MGKSGRPFKVHKELTELRNIIESGTLGSIKSLTAKHGIDAQDEEKRTPLIWATFFGNIELLNWLIENNANVNEQDRTGFTALHYCSQEQNLQTAKMLLSNGANPNLIDEHGNSPLWTALFNAKGNFELVKELRVNGANPEPKNLHGRSPDDMAMTIYEKTIDELVKLNTYNIL